MVAQGGITARIASVKTPAAAFAAALASLFALAPPPVRADPMTLWTKRCSLCHGVDGRAKTEQGRIGKMRDLTSRAWQASHSTSQIREVIEAGVPLTRMKAYKDKLDPEEIDALIALIRSFGN